MMISKRYLIHSTYVQEHSTYCEGFVKKKKSVHYALALQRSSRVLSTSSSRFKIQRKWCSDTGGVYSSRRSTRVSMSDLVMVRLERARFSSET